LKRREKKEREEKVINTKPEVSESYGPSRDGGGAKTIRTPP